MLRPSYIERDIPKRIVELMSEMESDMLATVARRINKFGRITGSTEYAIRKARQLDILYEELLDTVSKYSGKSSDILKNTFEEAGIKSLDYDNAIYKRAKEAGLETRDPMRYTDPAIQSILNASIQNAISVTNLTSTQCVQSGLEAYTKAMDKAFLSVSSGMLDLNSAYRQAIDDVARAGISVVEYTKSGKMIQYGIESAARRNIITAVNQATLKMQEANFKQMDCSLVEVSSHAGARPEHAVWQGGIYYWGKEVKGHKEFISTTGYGSATGLGGINCYHSWYPYYKGLSQPSFDKDPSEELGIDNDEHYELTQEQRRLERRVREAKKELNVYEAAGDDAQIQQARAKVSQRQSDLRNFVRENDKYLTRDYSREAIAMPTRTRNTAPTSLKVKKDTVSTQVAQKPVSSSSFKEATPDEFKSTLIQAKESMPLSQRWRVDVHDSYSSRDKLFVMDNGSCVAVEPSGNIVSVCKNASATERGVGNALLQKAVENGGDRLDAFGGSLYRFYTRNGFEPVSWTPFDVNYAPDEWKEALQKGLDVRQEEVVFYKYTGKTTSTTYEEFIEKTPPSADYDAAQKVRDEVMK